MNMRVQQESKLFQDSTRLSTGSKVGVMANGASVKKQSNSSIMSIIVNFFKSLIGKTESESKNVINVSQNIPKPETKEKTSTLWVKANISSNNRNSNIQMNQRSSEAPQQRPVNNRQKSYNDEALRNNRGIINEKPDRPSTPSPFVKTEAKPQEKPERPTTTNPFAKAEVNPQVKPERPTTPNPFEAKVKEPNEGSVNVDLSPPPPPIPKEGIPNKRVIEKEESGGKKELPKESPKPLGRERVSGDALKMGINNLKKREPLPKKEKSSVSGGMKFNESLLDKVGDTSVEASSDNDDAWAIPEETKKEHPIEQSKSNNKTVETKEKAQVERQEISDEEKARIAEHKKNINSSLAVGLERIRLKSGQSEEIEDEDW